jgi:hypothetical protein
MSAVAPPYYLSPDVHVAVGGERVILMDLARGDYFALEMDDARALGDWIRGWPVTGSSTSPPPALDQLLESGLLTRTATNGTQSTGPVTMAMPITSLLDTSPAGHPPIRFRDVLRFLVTSIFSLILLRVVSLKRITQYVRNRKKRAADFDLAKAQLLIAKFDYLYPWFFDRTDACLRNSFMLLQFLAQYGVYPDWVFGVRGKPFLAHCWLQQDRVVLNDHQNFTACLAPILIV